MNRTFIRKYTEKYFLIFYDICGTLPLLLMFNTFEIVCTSCYHKLGRILSERLKKSVGGVLPHLTLIVINVEGVLPLGYVMLLNLLIDKADCGRPTLHLQRVIVGLGFLLLQNTEDAIQQL